MRHKNSGNRGRKKRERASVRSKKLQHLNQRASLMDGAKEREREIINPKAEWSDGCCSCAQGNLREGKGEESTSEEAPGQARSDADPLGANLISQPGCWQCSLQPGILLPSSASGMEWVFQEGKSSPFASVVEQRLRFVTIW